MGFIDETSMPSWANSDSWLVDDDEDIDGQRQGGRHARDGAAAAAASKGGENAIVLSGPPGCGKTAAVVACAQVCACPHDPYLGGRNQIDLLCSTLLAHMPHTPSLLRGAPPLDVSGFAHTPICIPSPNTHNNFTLSRSWVSTSSRSMLPRSAPEPSCCGWWGRPHSRAGWPT